MTDYNERYVVFSSTGTSGKRPVHRAPDCPIHDTPKKALRVGGNRVLFNKLVHPEWTKFPEQGNTRQ